MCEGESTDHEGYTGGPPQLEERAVLRLVDENISVKHQKVLLAAVVLRVLALVLLLRWLLALALLLVLLRRGRRRGSILLAVRLAVVLLLWMLPVCMFLGRRVLLLLLVRVVLLLALRVSVRGLPLVVLVLHPLLDVGWRRWRWARPHVLPLVLVLGGWRLWWRRHVLLLLLLLLLEGDLGGARTWRRGVIDGAPPCIVDRHLRGAALLAKLEPGGVLGGARDAQVGACGVEVRAAGTSVHVHVSVHAHRV